MTAVNSIVPALMAGNAVILKHATQTHLCGETMQEAFEEAGGAFDANMAAKLEKHILSAGGSEEADELYLKFRGKMPGVEALLKGRGLMDAA